MAERQLFINGAAKNMAKYEQQKRHLSKIEENYHLERVQNQHNEFMGANLSYCGCGFLGIYHVGVASSLNKHAPQLRFEKFCGASAGALVAVAHICGEITLIQSIEAFKTVAKQAKSHLLGPFHPSFDINALLREILEKGLPDDVHTRVNGRLHISLTRFYDGENVIIDRFDSKEEVIQALICTCFIPIWSGIVLPKFKGVTYTDGGFTDNLLSLDDKTITVSPFAGEADICPHDKEIGDSLLSIHFSNTSLSLSLKNLYRVSHALMPPSTEVLDGLFARGFKDGIEFLQRINIACHIGSFDIYIEELEKNREIINNFHNNLIVKANYSSERIEKVLHYWLPILYASASDVLVYLKEKLKFTKVGEENHRKIEELVQYFSN